MNPAAPRRGLTKSLEVIAEFVSADPAGAPAEFVRELARGWKDRGGLLAGKPRHSDRYLDDLLRLQGTPVRSLTPKLGGRTNLKETDAEVLVRLFLCHWTYTGEELSRGGMVTAPLPDLYEPMLPGEDIAEVSAYVAGRIKAFIASAAEVRGTVEPAQALTLPGEDLSDLFEKFDQIVFSRLIGKSPNIQSHVLILLCRHLLMHWRLKKPFLTEAMQ